MSAALLEGHVVIVAGMGDGLGRSVARRAAAVGAAVVIASRTSERLAAVAAEVEHLGGRVLPHVADLVDPEACAALVHAALDTFGRLDGVVHTAFGRPPLGPLAERTRDDWHGALDANVLSATQVVDAAAAHLRAQRSGSVVLVSSISARQPLVTSGVYATMKAASLTLTKVYAQDLGTHNVRVNCVVPGFIQSDELEAFFAATAEAQGKTTEEVRSGASAATALGRFPTADEVADAAVFLLSGLSTAVTGQTLDVNAGHWYG